MSVSSYREYQEYNTADSSDIAVQQHQQQQLQQQQQQQLPTASRASSMNSTELNGAGRETPGCDAISTTEQHASILGQTLVCVKPCLLLFRVPCTRAVVQGGGFEYKPCGGLPSNTANRTARQARHQSSGDRAQYRRRLPSLVPRRRSGLPDPPTVGAAQRHVFGGAHGGACSGWGSAVGRAGTPSKNR